MSTIDTLEKPALQVFLEEIFARFGYNAVDMSDSVTVKTLFDMWQKGVDPAQAAVLHPHLFTVKTESTFEARLKAAKQALAGHTYALRQRVEELSAQAHKAAAHPNGLLNMSHVLQDLPQYGAKLRIYEDSQALLEIIREATGSAKAALDAAKADAVSKLVSLREPDGSVELAGATQGYKMVIKVLENTQQNM